MVKNYDKSVEINHSPSWLYIPDHPYRVLIIVGTGSGKINVLLNLIKHQQHDTDKIYWYFKDPFESKYQVLVNGKEKVRIEHGKNPKSYIDYSQTIDDAYERLEGYNPTNRRKALIVFDFIIADIRN